MTTVTITMANGYVFNHAVGDAQLAEFLKLAVSVLQPGETLSYK